MHVVANRGSGLWSDGEDRLRKNENGKASHRRGCLMETALGVPSKPFCMVFP